MKSFTVITDSSSGISQQEAKDLGIFVQPLSFTIDQEVYEEGVTLDRDAFFRMQAADAKISTSQPSPISLTSLWDRALQDAPQVLHMPITSALSSSYQTAVTLAESPEYAGRVFVADNQRIATPLRRAVMDALALSALGWNAPRAKQELEQNSATVFLAVDTLKYLHQGGRIPAATAVVGTMLNIKPVLKLQGPFSLHNKCRGMKQARKALIEAMGGELETTYREDVKRGTVQLMAASSAPPDVTADWVEQIKAAFPGMDVLCDDLSLSICCHTGPNALGIGCSVMPQI